MSYFLIQFEELLGGLNELSDPLTAGQRVSSVKYAFPASAAGISASPSHLDRVDENRGTYGSPPKLIDNYAPAGKITMRAYPNLMAPLLLLAGYTATVAQGAGTNAVHTLSITGAPTGGSLTLTYFTDDVATVPYNCTATQLRDILVGLRGFYPGDVTVTGGPLPTTPLVITYTGRQAAKVQATPTVSSAGLTGGTTPAGAVASTTAGATGAVTDPDGNGLTAGSYLWTFAKRTTSSAKTAQIIDARTENGVFMQGNGFGVSQLAITAAGEVTVDLMGLYVRRVADPGLSPTIDAASVLPLRRGDLSVDWLTGSAFTQDFNLTITNPIERGDHLGIASYFPKVLEHTGNPVQVGGSINKRTIDPDDFDAMLDARTFAATAKWIGQSSVGSSGKAYGMWVEMAAAQHTDATVDDNTNARRFGAQFPFEAHHDDVAGYDAQISLVCGVSATFETYA